MKHHIAKSMAPRYLTSGRGKMHQIIALKGLKRHAKVILFDVFPCSCAHFCCSENLFQSLTWKAFCGKFAYLNAVYGANVLKKIFFNMDSPHSAQKNSKGFSQKSIKLMAENLRTFAENHYN